MVSKNNLCLYSLKGLNGQKNYKDFLQGIV